MTARNELDRHLDAWLMSHAPSREPEHLLDQVLARTARTRRRPAWLIPERWIPMSAITSRLAPSSPVPWRALGLVAMLILALAVGAVLVTGARQRALPAPFGVAGNGNLLFSFGGDIVARRTPAGVTNPIVTGATVDDTPILSRDGSRLAFFRHGSGSSIELWVANVDGSGPRRLDLPFPTLSWVDWSGTGDSLLVANEDGQTTVAFVPTDGGHSTTIDLGTPAQVPTARPSDPQQILFRGKDAAGDWGLFLVGRDGATPRRLDLDRGFQTDSEYDINREYYFRDPSWSSDGRRLLYHTLEPAPGSPAGPGFRIHLADISPTGDVAAERILEFDSLRDDEFAAGWLPAGDGIVFQTLEGSTHGLAIAPLGATAGPARDLGVVGGDWITSEVSPDGRSLIAGVPRAVGSQPELSIIDLVSGSITPVDLGPDATWQRVAP